MSLTRLRLQTAWLAAMTALAALALACAAPVSAETPLGFKEAPGRRVESKSRNPYCEDAKRAYRSCYIPCSKGGHTSIGHVTNHCNVTCNNELVWVNYLCRPDPYLPFTN